MNTKLIVGGGILIVILLLLLKKKKAVVNADDSNVMVAPSSITNMPVTPDTSQLTNNVPMSPNPLDNSGSVVIEKRVDATNMPVGDSMIERLENPSGLALQPLMKM